ncbi:hypothetical protein EST38_g10606 [Candolleomyces aberdarensis]|uniref:PNPLA domain-containing protein n=1 Tax=Candolleomyces aberdarensis TaxID=2316362 RepID=A0A4Q2D7P2_9AGAR|nr:hypothetical protein EST38_g10606 [Candolleomyces aberdarensis]
MPPKAQKLDASSPDGKLRALSLDGGGFRGLGMLYVLDAITKAANARNRKPADPQLKPHEIFDIILGSSTGGLVAVLVGRLGLDCEKAIAEYKALATALFGTSRPEFMKTLLANKQFDAATIAKYDAAVAKLAGSAQDFYTDPVNNAKSGLGVAPLVPSFENSPYSSWKVHDVIRATTAAARYLPAYAPPSGPAGKEFRDAAYAGQTINPTITGKKYWDQNLGVLVNIGQRFSAVQLPDKATLTKADAKKFNDTFLNGAPEDPKVKTEETVLLYLKQIQTSQKTFENVKKEQLLQSAGVLQRLDPPLAPNDLGILELVDVFYEDEIKTEVQKWIASNQAQIDEIATKLVNQTKSEEDPDPNPNVLPYNPALDVQKPKEMLKYLNTYHVIFVIDDSTSMIMTDGYTAWDDNRWRQAQGSIGPIADFTFSNNVTSVDMGFMHYRRSNPFRGIQDSKNVLRVFQQARPPQDLGRIQRTPTGAVLKFFIDEAIKELNSKINNSEEYKKIRPTDIIVLTDGEADDDPKAVMGAARKEMDKNKHNHNYIGIQFVQIGNSSTTKLKLADMTKGEYGDMADLVPSDGTDLTPEKLTRIMLGGIHPTVRKKLNAQDLQ